MTTKLQSKNRVRQLRAMLGLTQAELAVRAGISRTAVTAIEGDRLVPSVEAALSLSKVLGTTVELLFSGAPSSCDTEIWASIPNDEKSQCWRAEVLGRTVLYPADSSPMLSLLPDQRMSSDARTSVSTHANETLVMACCDPAAGILASLFAASTGMRLIVLPRSSGQSVEMLRDGLTHLAGLHLSTNDEPERNSQFIYKTLGAGYQAIRLARWQEGIVMPSETNLRSVRSVMRAKLNWVGREPGSGARQCLDRLLGNRFSPEWHCRDVVCADVPLGWSERFL